MRASAERVEINLVERSKRASNIVINNISENTKMDDVETVMEILSI